MGVLEDGEDVCLALPRDGVDVASPITTEVVIVDDGYTGTATDKEEMASSRTVL